MQGPQSIGGARQQTRAAAKDGGMMRAIRLNVRLDRAGRDRVTKQIRRAATNMTAHFLFPQRRQAVQGADVVDAGRNRRIAIAEGAVEVEEDRSQARVGLGWLLIHGNLTVLSHLGLRAKPQATVFCSRYGARYNWAKALSVGGSQAARLWLRKRPHARTAMQPIKIACLTSAATVVVW